MPTPDQQPASEPMNDDLESQIEGMLDEASAASSKLGDAVDASGATGEAVETTTPDEDAPSDQADATIDTPSSEDGSDASPDVEGLDDLLAEAATKTEETLSPLDEPSDEVEAIEEDLDEALNETNDEASDDENETETVEPSSGGDEDDDETEAAPEDIASVVDETLNEPGPKPDNLYDDSDEDDPDDTDMPEVFGPGADLYDDSESNAVAGASSSSGAAEARSPAEASSAEAVSPGADPGVASDGGEARAGVLAKARGAIGPALGPLGGLTVRAADIISSPLAKLPVEKRDLFGYFAIVTLFNAVAVFVVFVVLG